jgi:hypothetical protein
MKCSVAYVFSVVGILTISAAASAQRSPELGYIFPAGGKAGTTVEVRLGGYDWTPDMEYFVHDQRVRLVPTGPPGPILIPGPPYWFGAKGRLPALPLPREVPAKLIIPADLPPGPIRWQAVNANGATASGMFIVSSGTEVVEDEGRKTPQLLPVPATVSGRIGKIEEVDRYRFTAPKDGPITCDLTARRLGVNFHGVLQVRDSQGGLLADVAGTDGVDPSLTFAARAGAEYVVSIHDIDFGGDRSYVYRLSLTAGPRVVGALPAAGRRGETREVEFIGYGIASGLPRLESVKQMVMFPANVTASFFDYSLPTPFGTAAPFRLLLGDLPESVSQHGSKTEKLRIPAGVTGVLEQPGAVDRYFLDGKKGDAWSLVLEARRIGSPLDVTLTVLGPDGKELARSDDLPETTDAGLEFTVPADGMYQIVVSDMAGKSGTRAAIYRLVVRQPESDFALQLAGQRVSVPIGGKFDLAVKAMRKGACKGPIALTVTGLPAGISVPPNLTIPADKNDLMIPLQAAADAPSGAGLVSVVGSATVGSATLTRNALARAAGSLAAPAPEENNIPLVMVAAVMKPRCKGRPVDQDTGRKVHRGTTFPAEVIVERLEGYSGEIVLQMASRQSYQVHGITGHDVVVPPGTTRALYPCFMPEWLETSRTSRMGIIATVKVADSKGKVRYLVNDITGFVTMTMEGALLKISHDEDELELPAGQPFDVHLKLSRLAKLAEPVRLELRPSDEQTSQLRAEPLMIPAGKEQAVFRIIPAASLHGQQAVTIRGTALQDGKYPVISETSVSVNFLPAAAAKEK